MTHEDDQKLFQNGFRAKENNVPFQSPLHSAPMLFTRDGHNLSLGGMYQGNSAFLICSGPSLKTHDLSLLNQRGILTCAINNAASMIRPNLWVGTDDPGNFCDVIWKDPGIQKFMPLGQMQKTFYERDEDNKLVPSEQLVGDMPAVFGFRRNEKFDPDVWLYENTFNWGNHAKNIDLDGNNGARSTMYIALRLLFYLGIRKLYLVGCDFKMEAGTDNYAFEQDCDSKEIKMNNKIFRVMNSRLRHLLPHFEREGYEIINCTPDSGLTVFPYLPFEEAVSHVSELLPQKIMTSGMYDKKEVKQESTEGTSDNGEKE